MVSPTAVRQWAERGELNALTTPGGHRRFLPAEIERFAQQKGLTLNTGLAGDNDRVFRILIADDDDQLRDYLVELVTGTAVEVVTETAINGFEAGLKVSEFEPQVILLDLVLPGVDGFQVCRQLKQGPNTKDIRVIAMSGECTQENVGRILSAGAEACLAKPIDANDLLSRLGLNDLASV